MCEQHLTSLGFTDQEVPVGTHMCLVFTEDEERADCLRKFLLSGLKIKERSACFSNHTSENEMRSFLSQHDITYDDRKEKQDIFMSGASDVYFQDNTFDPDRMLGLLDHFYQETKDLGYSAARVIGEMNPEIEKVKGGERLLEYESRVSLMLKEKPVTAICQYNANLFDGATIMEVLKVHPQMMVNGAVVENPFFIEPEDYLSHHVT
ncbi:MAG: MEDS domain-containing protein [Planctomycetes bacterium]|nr:MEDS domain-containing protein [Planctomycetota bacterium]